MTTYFNYPAPLLQQELKCIAQGLVAPGKGVLSADESISTMRKRLEDIGLYNDEDNRRLFRELLFTADEQIKNYVSGVIMFHETLYQRDSNETAFVELLRDRCIMTGIKVDAGVVNLNGSEGETTTQGLDNLSGRCMIYKRDGCDFAKWRCVLKIGKNTPSYQAILENANVIGRFAAICQSQRLVPIIQPEIMPDGDHDIERCQKVTETVLAAVYKALSDHHVFLEGTVLKQNMITPGRICKKRATSEEIAEATVNTFLRTVPPAVPGILLLTGGQTDEEAARNLHAINVFPVKKPWKLTFSFGRAQLSAVIRIWEGKPNKVARAQEQLLLRLEDSSSASLGQYEVSSK